MNKNVEQFAKQAGFVFWNNEEWGPGPGHIDWSSDYSKELEEYTRLIVEACALFVENNPCFSATDNLAIAEQIRLSFGVDT